MVVVLIFAAATLFVLAGMKILRCEIVTTPIAVIFGVRIFLHEMPLSNVWTWTIVTAIPFFSVALYYFVDACALVFARALMAIGHDAPRTQRRFRRNLNFFQCVRTAR